MNRTCGAVCVDCCRIVCRSSWQRHVRVCISSRLSISCWLTVYMKSWETRHHSWVRQQRVWSTWWRQFHSRQTEQMSCRGDWITPTHSSRPRFTTSQRYQPQVMMTFWQQAASHIMPLLGTEWPRLLRTPQQRLAVLFSQTDNPQILPLSVGESPPHQIHGSLGPHESVCKRDLDRFSCYSCTVYRSGQHTDGPCYMWHLSQ